MFQDGSIHGVLSRPIRRFTDSRGWLSELFRQDELDPRFYPVMAYISMTLPGVVRGPHEHRDQADYFCFIGPSEFKLYLWDSRRDSPTYGKRHALVAGTDRPQSVIVPIGVVHAYKNIGTEPGIVFNCPNRLYAGWGKREPVDEIRHEDEAGMEYLLW